MTFTDPPIKPAPDPTIKTKIDERRIDNLSNEVQELRDELARSKHHHHPHDHRQPSILPHVLLATAIGLVGVAVYAALNDESKRHDPR
jgi:hypothetical protein